MVAENLMKRQQPKGSNILTFYSVLKIDMDTQIYIFRS
jgi:hypothetical protein